MRTALSSVPMDGIVVIGEGEKAFAPMLFNGEKIGDGTPPLTDIAVDPIDGTTLTAQGRAAPWPSSPWPSGVPCSTPARASTWRSSPSDPGEGRLDICGRQPSTSTPLSEPLGRPVRDLTAVILDRPATRPSSPRCGRRGPASA